MLSDDDFLGLAQGVDGDDETKATDTSATTDA